MSIFETGHLSLHAVPQSRPIDVDVHVSRCRYWCRPKCRWWCWCWFWCIWACLRQSSYLSRISRFISVEKKLSCGEISIQNLNNLWSFIEVYAVFVPNLCRENMCGEKMTNMRSGLRHRRSLTLGRASLGQASPSILDWPLNFLRY